MRNRISAFLFGGFQRNSTSQNIGFFILRFFVGLALCTVFEKFLPKNGIWGPQEWFIQDTANMGFPFPAFFAWLAVLSEFFGGILLMLGLFTRPAALMNFFVTFTATFVYHKGAIAEEGLLSFFFMIMCSCIFLFGPGQFSLDYLLKRKTTKRMLQCSTIFLLLLPLDYSAAQVRSSSVSSNQDADASQLEMVRFSVRNNSLLPKRITFIIYKNRQVGNNTLVKWILPFQKISFDLPENSKLYVASKAQVNRVMQGKRIDRDEPFIVVDKKMRHSTIPLKGN